MHDLPAALRQRLAPSLIAVWSQGVASKSFAATYESTTWSNVTSHPCQDRSYSLSQPEFPAKDLVTDLPVWL